MVSMGYKGVKGMEQVIYKTQRLSFGDVHEAQIIRRDRLGADEIRHNLANTQLEENFFSYGSTRTDGANPQPKEYVSSNVSGATMTAYAKRYCSAESFSLDWPELDPALWRELACAALVEHQNTQGVKLEITGKVSAVSAFLPYLCCFHLNFEVNDTTGTTKKMFAEVFKYDNGACKVNFCDIMDPTNPDVMKGCLICSRKILHPKGVKFCNID